MAKPIPRLPLNALRVFEAVGRLRSMARAAEELNVQPSAVSMHMRNLTAFVERPLVERKGRELVVTPQGHELLRSVASGLGQIEQTILELRKSARQSAFTLSVLPAFLHRWLMPRLPGLEQAHPRLAMRILASRHLANLHQGEADAAVRLGSGRWPGLTSRRLMGEFLLPVCAPSQRPRGRRLRPGELPRGRPLLSTTVDPWSRWSPALPDTQATRGITVDDPVAVLSAAENGQGIALTRWTLAADALAHGRLVPLGDPIPYRSAYYWVAAPHIVGDTREESVFQWLAAQVAAMPAPV
jgi:LysR family glycine cleavage system transcriptional activator